MPPPLGEQEQVLPHTVPRVGNGNETFADPRQPIPREVVTPANWRRLVLPVHLLCLAPLLGGIGAVAGDVKLEDDGVVHDPVNRRGGGHGVGEDAFSLGEDQVGRDAQRPAFVAFGDQIVTGRAVPLCHCIPCHGRSRRLFDRHY